MEVKLLCLYFIPYHRSSQTTQNIFAFAFLYCSTYEGSRCVPSLVPSLSVVTSLVQFAVQCSTVQYHVLLCIRNRVLFGVARSVTGSIHWLHFAHKFNIYGFAETTHRHIREMNRFAFVALLLSSAPYDVFVSELILNILKHWAARHPVLHC
jgi:hypothetical protein